MKINAAEYSSDNATPEEIRELVSDDAKRGEFMILEKGEDDFVQIAEGAEEGFVLEYREGERMFRCMRNVSRDEAEGAFLDYIDGLDSWKSRFSWELLEFRPQSSGRLAVVVAVVVLAALVCLAIMCFARVIL